MDTLDVVEIKKKSISGIIALTSRTFILQIIAFVATFLLTIFLSPAIFGIFYVVSAIINFLAYFSDIGLAAALIQKKEDLTPEDFSTTFTIQQALVLLVVIIAFVFSAQVTAFYKLDNQGLWLFRALVFSFFLSSLKTIPSVIIERKLDFHLLVIPQIAETLGFYVVAVILAWQGYGLTSFIWAVITRAVVGTIAIYIISPWKITLGFSKPVAKKLLRFGLPFQTNSLLALVKDDLMTVFLGKILPFAEIGYLGWAKKWAEVPLRLIMDSIVRVTFPAFSRLQSAGHALRNAIEKTIFGLSILIFPITTGLIFFVGPMVTIIPRYSKWEPALLSFYLFALASAVSSLSAPLTNALNAIGKIKVTLFLMILWTALTWALSVLFINLFGYQGFALALFLITFTIVLVVYLVKREASDFSFWRSIRYPLIGAILQGLCYWLLRGTYPYNIFRLILAGGLGSIIYIGVVYWTEKTRILEILESFKHKS